MQQVQRRVFVDEALVDDVLESGIEAQATFALGKLDPREPEIELCAPELALGRRAWIVLSQEAFDELCDAALGATGHPRDV